MRRFVLLTLALALIGTLSTPTFAHGRRGVFRQRTVARGFGGGAVVVPGQAFSPLGGYGTCGNVGVGAAFIPMQQQIQYVPVQSAVVGGCNNVGAAFAPGVGYGNVGVGLAPVGGIGGARVFRQRTVIRGW